MDGFGQTGGSQEKVYIFLGTEREREEEREDQISMWVVCVYFCDGISSVGQGCGRSKTACPFLLVYLFVVPPVRLERCLQGSLLSSHLPVPLPPPVWLTLAADPHIPGPLTHAIPYLLRLTPAMLRSSPSLNLYAGLHSLRLLAIPLPNPNIRYPLAQFTRHSCRLFISLSVCLLMICAARPFYAVLFSHSLIRVHPFHHIYIWSFFLL